jgi:hypothetical protein
MSDEQEPKEELEAVSVFAAVYYSIQAFSSLAFQRMGLHADEVTGQVEKDMKQAKVAVDTALFLCDQMMLELDEEGKRELQALMSDLRLNYAKQAGGES